MTDKQIRDRIVGALSVSMMPMETEAECVAFLDRCIARGAAVQTNADRIRAEVFAKISTDEAVADVILALDISLSDEGKGFTSVYCHEDNGCVDENDDITCNDEMRKTCILRWLRQPAEEVLG